MQYLLTHDELNALQRAAEAKAQANKAALQRVCTLAAKHTPVPRPWEGPDVMKPWGCILDKESHPGYCDDCPVSDICPHDDKEWSK